MMQMSTQSIAYRSAHHPWKIVGVWTAIAVVALVYAVTHLDQAITTQATFTSHPESKIAADLLHDRLPSAKGYTMEVVIVRSSTHTIKHPEFRAFAEQLSEKIEALPATIVQPDSLISFYRLPTELLISADRHIAVIAFKMSGSLEEAKAHVEMVQHVVKDVSPPAGFDVLQVGEASIAFAIQQQSHHDLLRGESFGLLIALLILLFLFKSLVAAVIPIVLAVLAVVITLGLASVIGQIAPLSFFIVNVTTTVGLAVGIDYTLLIIQRYREERSKGLDKLRAIEKVAATAMQTVMCSGMIVVCALLSLFLVPFSTFISVGLGATSVTMVALLASLTLLPALLSLLGDGINTGRLPFTSAAEGRHAPQSTSGVWGTLSRLVMARPLVSVILAGSLLCGATIPFFDLTLGFIGAETLPDHLEVKKGFTLLNREFSVGYLMPAEIVLAGDVGAPETWDGLSKLLTLLRQDQKDAFGKVDPLEDLQTRQARKIALLRVPVLGNADSLHARQSIVRLRKEFIPAAFTGAPVEVFVGGTSAFSEDFATLARNATPGVVSFVLCLSFVFLMLVFRSIVVPLKAIVLNLLSVGAAYGLLVAIFQKGWGQELFGFRQTETIQPWLPLFLFAILFGLSMDYHVFLLRRIREHYDQTHDNRRAVAFGLRTTAQLINGAALIMVAVFGGIASGELVAFQQMGFGLAVAVFLDATIVRSVLVPATMVLFGRANWYLPTWLRWLPKLSYEREPLPGIMKRSS
jgi:RND superfamily putative drug exporter